MSEEVCDKSPYHTLLHLSHSSIVRYTLISYECLDVHTAINLDLKNESKVLVLYTGGTIGMVRNRSGVLVPEANAMEANIRRIVTMHDEQYSQVNI